jgi:hypothetical protein
VHRRIPIRRGPSVYRGRIQATGDEEGGGLASPDQLEQGIRESIRHLSNDLKFERVLYYRYDHDSHSLRLKYQVGLAEGHACASWRWSWNRAVSLPCSPARHKASTHRSVRNQLVRKYQDDFSIISVIANSPS